jgi:hypothetical protein
MTVFIIAKYSARVFDIFNDDDDDDDKNNKRLCRVQGGEISRTRPA